ncbi:MAG: thioredoxin family protein [Deltaproteobacteria bacterium]|nr:MAG: thioredoxin family protein [Deltaproteobacteria bacterium]
MKVQVLGTGCMKCNKLYEAARQAIDQAGVPAELEKVENILDMMKFGVAVTPALVIDGKVKAAGKIPSVEQIAAWLKEARED